MNYEDLTREQLVNLLAKREAQARLGLTWERDEIEHDQALNSDFVAMTLDMSTEGSCGPGPWRNVIIEGDNFNALRWLRMTMSGRVRCILIDPPYNTGGKDLVYNDRYVNTRDRFRNSLWLEFLYRRLLIARDLLTEDGVILVCINDENRAYLELMMDQIFPGMRAGSFVWKTRSGSNDSGSHSFSVDHEHVLVFAKPGFEFTGASKSFKDYKNPDNDPRGPWKTGDLSKGHSWRDRPGTYYPLRNPATDVWYPCNPTRVWAFSSEQAPPPWRAALMRKKVAKTAGGLSDRKSGKGKPLAEDGVDQQPEALGAATKKQSRQPAMEEWIRREKIVWPDAATERVVVWETKEALLEAIRSGDVPTANRGRTPLLTEDLPDLDFWVGKKVSFERPWFRRHLSDVKSATSLVSSWVRGKTEQSGIDDDETEEVVAQRSGTSEDSVKEILGDQAFSFPKPPSLIRELLRFATDTSDIVLDFFAGSGTTAHAVLALNAEEGDRTFILVSNREATPESPERNLCRDVCAARVRRVIEGYGQVEGLGGNFAYLREACIPFEDLAYDLAPEQVWLTIQMLHGCELRPMQAGTPLQTVAVGEDLVVFCDKTSGAALEQLSGLAAQPGTMTVYAYTPGPVRQALSGRDGVEIRPLPDTLIQRFQS